MKKVSILLGLVVFLTVSCNKKELETLISDVSFTPCKQTKATKSVLADNVNVKFTNQGVQVTHHNFEVPCDFTTVNVNHTLVNGVLRITQQGTPNLADCICYTDVSYTINGILQNEVNVIFINGVQVYCYNDDKVLYGTEQNPYQIGTASELAALAAEVNAGDDKAGKFYRMSANIDLSDYGADFNGGKGWIPIGHYAFSQSEHPFNGNFDGNGFKVSGLFIDNDITLNLAMGLFGYVSGGTVKNLGVEADIKGGYRIGGVAGRVSNGGSIKNCYVTGVVRGLYYIGGVVGYVWSGSVKNCYSTAMVIGDEYGGLVGVGNSVGGVVGEIVNSIVKNCYSTGAVSGNTDVGGVVGSDPFGGIVSSIINCYATGAVSGSFSVGGVRGSVSGNVKNCAALNPNITRTGGSQTVFGRVAGRIFSNASLTNNVAWDGMQAFGGITFNAGTANNNGANITSEQAKTAVFWTTTTPTWDGWDVNIWNIADGRLPTLKNVGGNQNANNAPAHLQR